MNTEDASGEGLGEQKAQGEPSRPIFILGDSRTGTTSLHRFLKALGYRSIHYFFKESGVTQPTYDDFSGNWERLKAFIDGAEYEAFSDYPLRTFYKELFSSFPDAYFVLSVRKDVETWQKSMTNFFSKFQIELNIEDLTKFHVIMNDDIRRIAAETGARFCEVCVDENPEIVGSKLANFLGHEGVHHLGHENQSAAFETNAWSRRVTLYETSSATPLEYVKSIVAPSKAVLSERAWIFLINDSSNFMDYYYGYSSWSGEIVDRAAGTLKQRVDELASKGIVYIKYAIPEKASVYGEFLPRVLQNLPVSTTRPALQLAGKGVSGFRYPLEWIVDAKSQGNIYFRGDSHMNWLGAFNLYVAIAEDIRQAVHSGVFKRKFNSIIPLRSMIPQLAGYGGDLFGQLDKESASYFQKAWSNIDHGPMFEYLVKYNLDTSIQKSTRSVVEPDYLEAIQDRETLRYTNPDKSLPRAVIFRDSTSDYLTDLLAEHFSECIFIWHKGLVYSDVIEREKPDIVLHIMAERFLVQYEKASAFHTLWPETEAHEAES